MVGFVFSTLLVLIVIALLAIILLFIYYYNRLVVLRNQIDNAWAQIDVQLKRRYDLIPNLIETVKGYVKHERETLEAVTKARAAMAQATTVGEKARAHDLMTSALKSLFAVAEEYPRLRANQNFLQLQEELSGTESKIAYARQFYNDSVLEFNNKCQTFPSSIVAALFGFRPREYFQIEEAARAPVKVKF
ncbi:MAG: LemA family protein [Candidatus Micrarchaeia archaeon]